MDTFNVQPRSNQNQVKDPIKRLESLTHKTDTVLFKAEAIFPFDLFPDEIVIDLEKVNIIYKQFFYSEQLYPILIRNIEGVIVESSILFSTLKIEVTRFINEPVPLKYLKNSDALRAKRLIMGLIACTKEGIDPSSIEPHILINKLEEVGASGII